MLPKTISESENPASASRLSADQAATIRVQLDRLLASPQFRTSKRCQSLLSFVIGAYLEGALDRIKERVVGVEVFGRVAGYDTNQDSVVRTTAAEVRKRLAQYYLEPNHEHEIRVLLPPGSYLPEFRFPAAAIAPAVSLPQAIPEPIVLETGRQRRWIWAAAGVLLASGLAIWGAVHFRRNELDEFWKPLIDDRSDVVICIEQPLRIYAFAGNRVDELNGKMVASSVPSTPEVLQNSTATLAELKPVGTRYFSFGDTMASIRIAELLARKGKAFQVLGDRAASFRDLRGRPAVLVGEFNNQWTNGFIRDLRFYLDKNPDEYIYEVRDRQNGGKVIASVSRSVNRPVEYAIVSRVFDPSTEKAIIAVAGMTYASTGAVGDFLTSQTYLREALGKAPADWSRKSIQVVLETNMVNGTPGPPRVIATHFW